MTVFTDPDTVYWISFVLITKAQTRTSSRYRARRALCG